jgi:hypothetical protein
MEFASSAMSLDAPSAIPSTTARTAATTPSILMQDQRAMCATWSIAQPARPTVSARPATRLDSYQAVLVNALPAALPTVPAATSPTFAEPVLLITYSTILETTDRQCASSVMCPTAKDALTLMSAATAHLDMSSPMDRAFSTALSLSATSAPSLTFVVHAMPLASSLMVPSLQ